MAMPAPVEPSSGAGPRGNLQQPAGPSPSWASFHLFIDGEIYGSAGDRLLLDAVAPLARDLLGSGRVSRYFFIRYREDGPHLRLRLRGRPEILTREVVPEVNRRAAGPSWAAAGLTRLVAVAYEPELGRYGGPAATALAERLFYASSEAAVELLRPLAGPSRRQRLGRGLLAMLVLLQVFVRRREPAAALAAGYADAFLAGQMPQTDTRELWSRLFTETCRRQGPDLGPTVSRAWRSLEQENGELPEPIETYRRRLLALHRRLRNLARGGRLDPSRATLPWQQVVASLVPSYLHMMNNRLGIDPREEAYLARLIAETLGEPR